MEAMFLVGNVLIFLFCPDAPNKKEDDHAPPFKELSTQIARKDHFNPCLV
jgi:hypothetical protein